MAIIIPSKNIYDKQNPKVRDNVIERIEVGAVEVVPDNEYDSVVLNQSINISDTSILTVQGDSDFKYGVSVYENAVSLTFSYALAYCAYKNVKKSSFSLKIPVVKDDKYISKIKYGVGDDDLPNIKYTLYGRKKTGVAQNPYNGTITTTMNSQSITASMGTVVLSEPSDEQEEQIIYILNEVEQPSSITVTGTNGTPISVTATATQYLQGNLKDVSDTSSNENEILLEIKDIVVGATVVRTAGGGYNKPSGAISGQMSGAYIEYEATRIEVTVYGDTIGIDLVDKTVYINDETAKKVHSFEGNELMQTTNTKGEIVVWTMQQNQDYGTEILGGTLPLNRTKITFYSQNAINSKKTIYAMGGIEFSVAAGVAEYTYKGIISVRKIVGELDGRVQVISDMYANTQRQYANGKETATIRCSISDYYDGDQKIIAIDNSTGKMSFDIGDQVIPRVYGADGKDRPMSTYKNGSEKVFQVLGSKIFYDGAVWQELSLQEV